MAKTPLRTTKRKHATMLGSLKGLLTTARKAQIAVLVAASLAVSFVSAAFSFSIIAQNSRPDIAVAAWGWNGDALTEAGVRTFARGNNSKARSKAKALASEALEHEPLNATALFLLGAVDEVDGSLDQADRLMHLAERISRRNVATQLWLVERSVDVNDMAGALHHYDIALRTNLSIQPTLFPILLDATTDPEVRKSLLPYARGNSAWFPQLIDYAVASNRSTGGVAKLLMEARLTGPAKPGTRILGALTNQLVGNGDIELARIFHARMTDSPPAIATSTSFSQASTNPLFSPITWETYQTDGANTYFAKRPDNNRPALTIELGSDQRILAARKLVFVTPGAYAATVSVASNMAQGAAAASLSVNCFVRDGERFSPQRINIATRSAREWVFQVPTGCPAVYISLEATSQAAQEISQLVVTNVSLRKI